MESMASFITIGKKISILRQKRKMTQEDLAGEAEINRAFLSNIENGRVNFSIAILLKIAHSLNVPASQLLDD
jgi:transcriptional regulator with XRE-family HTH domain